MDGEELVAFAPDDADRVFQGLELLGSLTVGHGDRRVPINFPIGKAVGVIAAGTLGSVNIHRLNSAGTGFEATDENWPAITVGTDIPSGSWVLLLPCGAYLAVRIC